MKMTYTFLGKSQHPNAPLSGIRNLFRKWADGSWSCFFLLLLACFFSLLLGVQTNAQTTVNLSECTNCLNECNTARMVRTTDINTNTNQTDVTVGNYNIIDFQDGITTNAAAGTFTVIEDGLYRINGSIRWVLPNPSANAYVLLRAEVNGTVVQFDQQNNGPSIANGLSNQVNTLQQLSAGDVVSLSYTSRSTPGILINYLDFYFDMNREDCGSGASSSGSPQTLSYNNTTSDLSISDGNTVNLNVLQDHDFYEVGTTAPPNNISDAQYTIGHVGIGTNSPAFINPATSGLEVQGSNAVVRLEHDSVGRNTELVQTGAQFKIHVDPGNAFADSDFEVEIDGNDIMYLEEGGNVGIGTSSPAFINLATSGLEVQGSNAVVRLEHDGIGRNTELVQTGAQFKIHVDPGNAFVDSDFEVEIDGNDIMYLEEGGNVGIGTTSPTATLSVNGTANKPGGGSWAVFSDARSKENIHIYTKGLAELTQLRPVSFSYKEEFDFGSDTHVGLIAQEVEKVAPSMVSEIKVKDIKDFKEVNPNELTYMLINAVKELKDKITNLEIENAALKAEATTVKDMEDRLTQMEIALGTKVATALNTKVKH